MIDIFSDYTPEELHQICAEIFGEMDRGGMATDAAFRQEDPGLLDEFAEPGGLDTGLGSVDGASKAPV